MIDFIGLISAWIMGYNTETYIANTFALYLPAVKLIAIWCLIGVSVFYGVWQVWLDTRSYEMLMKIGIDI